MDFGFGEESRLLGDGLEKFLSAEYGFERRKAIVASAAGWSREIWAQLAATGVLGLTVPQAHGGFGSGPEELIVTATALGRHLVVEPWVASVLAGKLVEYAGSAAQREALLGPLAAGDSLLTAALYEPGARYALAPTRTTARRAGGRWTLTGAKAVVPFGGEADAVLVSARTDGDPEGDTALFRVTRGAAGFAARGARALDGQRHADLVFDATPAERLGAGDAAPAIEQAVDVATALACVQAVGMMETLNALTLEHLKTRQQFGQPIGRFQVLQHRAVDMFVHCEQSRSIAWLALAQALGTDAAARRRAVSAAKAHVGRSARAVAQAGVQLHGGLGVAEELPAAHYAKALTLFDFALGDAGHHLERFVAGR